MVPTLKKIIATLCYRGGVLPLIFRIRYYNQAVVYMYHRVIESTSAYGMALQPSMYVEPATFENHLLFLKRNFKIIKLSNLIGRLEKRRNVGRYCSLTFDDGWIDNYDVVYPLLLKHNIPVTIFLATSFIGAQKQFWQDQVSTNLLKILNSNRESLLPLAIRNFIVCVGGKKNNCNELIDKIIVFLKTFELRQRNKLVDDICSTSSKSVKLIKRSMMNWDEVREMAESGLVEFGAHTVNHEFLDQLDDAKITKEIQQSREHIETEIGEPCTLFSYPNGNVNNNIIDIIRTLGFNGAVTTKRGGVVSDIDLMAIPRIGIHQDVSNTTAMFYWRMTIR